MALKGLIKRLNESDVIKEADGIEALGFLSEFAAVKVSRGLRHITEAGIALHTIHDHKLWQYGDFSSFESFLTQWSDENSLGRSTGWYIVNAVSLWISTGHEPEDLLLFKGGVNAMRPLLEDRDSKIVRERDRGTGEVTELADGWQAILEEKYPDVEPTPHNLVAMWIDDPDNLDEAATGRSVRGTLRDQTVGRPKGKQDRIKFRLVVQYKGAIKTPVNISWQFFPAEGRPSDGKSIASMLRRPHVLRAFLSRLGIESEPGG